MKKNILRFLSLFIYLFVSQPVTAQWIRTSSLVGGFGYTQIYCLSTLGESLFAGGYGGIYRSSDNGTSWVPIDSGLSNYKVCAFAIVGSNILAATYGGGVFLSTNNGTYWTAANTGLTSSYILTFTVSDNNLFAGTQSGVFLSTNSGTNWSLVDSGLTYSDVQVLALSDSNIFVGTTYGGVFLSTNNGDSWAAVNTGLPTNSCIYSLIAFSNTSGVRNLFTEAGVWGSGSHGAPTVYPMGIFRSTNNGTNWTAVNSNLVAYAFAVSGTNIFAGTSTGVFLSTNNGIDWIDCNTGLTWPEATTLTISGANLFVAIPDGSVWRRPLSEVITSAETRSTDRPTQYNLNQNYPNPFNPTTNISFSIPLRSFVSLKIYDVVGREVSTITSEEMSAGSYVRQWNANDAPSGVYYCRLQAGSYNETRKLILLK